VRDEGTKLLVRLVPFARQALRDVARMPSRSAAGAAEARRDDPERDRYRYPRGRVADVQMPDEGEPEHERSEGATDRESHGRSCRSEQQRDVARPVAPERRELEDPRSDGAGDEEERRDQMKEEQRVRHRVPNLRAVEDGCDNRSVDARERHLRLLTETIEAVNSTLDLEEVLALVARKVADALGADACFVYLYDERTDELVLRATHGTHVAEMTRRPRMHPGEGITGAAAAERAPVMIPAQADLDPRFKSFANLPEDEYESILAVPILARERLAGALNVRTVQPREFTQDEIDLLVAIAAQVAQTLVHAQLYAEAQRRVAELEALARISEAVSESLYLEESLEAIVNTTMEAVGATGAALVLEDGEIAWPEGRAGAYAVRLPLRWKRRQIGELVCDRDTPFTEEERALLASIAHHAAVALEHGRAVMRGVLAQEIHHRVKNNLQTVASLLRLQARSENADPRKALEDSVNRILAIAAVHEVLTERREEEVELAELLDRLRSMLVQGLAANKDVQSELASVPLAGSRATALALVFSELFQNALEHGGSAVRIELAQRNGEVVLSIADDGRGIEDHVSGTGLSIVKALVRDELQGRLELRNDRGTRAEVVFPA
jgi:two-component system, sensor histidine kinase PdtaS